MSEGLSTSTVLYQTKYASLAQLDDRQEFVLNFFSETLHFRACELLAFKRKIKEIDLVKLLTESEVDIEVIPMPHCDRIMVFTIHEILELRDLLSGAFAMLELNSLIHKELIRRPI